MNMAQKRLMRDLDHQIDAIEHEIDNEDWQRSAVNHAAFCALKLCISLGEEDSSTLLYSPSP